MYEGQATVGGGRAIGPVDRPDRLEIPTELAALSDEVSVLISVIADLDSRLRPVMTHYPETAALNKAMQEVSNTEIGGGIMRLRTELNAARMTVRSMLDRLQF